ncbi:lysophospholipid acyltransferase family protein [Geminisphaera colitermitum]|uniref:lysophospholipid acyltransferase family protein n=1 Tax=Geminisphaera colitermitum TaxID=1148786 RepID=UPI000196535C|nr:lysophospholipid acyltransferase family protein [Geminisphaera colitermitum]
MNRWRWWDCMRGGWRLAVIGTVIGLAVARWLGGSVRVKRRTPAERARWMQAVCRDLLRVMGVRVTPGSSGLKPGASAEAGLMVCNHLGYLDILVLAADRPVIFVAKSEVRGWPVLGWLAGMAGTLFVDRARRGDVARVAEEMTEALAGGVSVAVFLEGTSSDGSRVLSFKTSLLEPAIRRRWLVLPMSLDYTVPAGRSAAGEVCWWGDMRLAPHLLNLVTIPWIRARVARGEAVAAAGDMDRKTLARLLHERVEALRAAGGNASRGQGRRCPPVVATHDSGAWLAEV